MDRRIGLVAVALCLGGALTACGNGAGEGRAATGPVGRPGGSGPVPPSGEVVLVPLDGRGPSPGTETGTGTGTETGTATSAPSLSPAPPHRAPAGSPPTAPAPGRSAPPVAGAPAGGPAPPPGPPSAPRPQQPSQPPQPPGSQPPQPAPGTTAPPRPAALTVGEPQRAPTDRRWCETVIVRFHNTGGSPARSGTVTFATHVIGALGVDWATIESAQPLPAPIPAGAARTGTYTVCVDAWRVPLGMRIETQDVTASWT
ncbi:hypothetical protein ACFT5C_33310 [Streptomyces sp. NPDC057116]|uniref:hypothetical protein n=1 Tax=Streptomyces sp. NPDC057116 TaxID=3346023 RepID=UPI003634D2AE